MSSDADEFLRAHRRQRPQDEERETEEPPKSPPGGLVSQGGRSAGMPIGRPMTPDDLIRQAAAYGRGSVWTRIV